MATIVQPSAIPQRMSVEQFLDYRWEDTPWRDHPVELVHGEVRVAPMPAGVHAHLVGLIYDALRDYVRPRGLGRVYGDGTGYRLPHRDDTVRGPDVSFVRAGRLPATVPLTGLPAIAPDLAVEVLSPSDTPKEVAGKLDDFFGAGTELVWLVDPRGRWVDVVTPDRARHRCPEGAAAHAEPVLPDFALDVAALFEDVERAA